MKVLFLGNSFTYYNDLPKMVMKMGRSMGMDLTTDSVTRGGARLCQFADPQDELYPKWKALYDGEDWDFVVFQEQSAKPMLQTEEYISSVKQLRSLLRPDQKVILYQTWSYKDGTEKLGTVQCTYREMWTALEAACRRAGAEMQMDVIPVGRCFATVYELHPELEMYQPDAFHPSPAGSYMAACLFLSYLSGQSPQYFPIPECVPTESGEIIRSIADWAEATV